MKKGQVRQKKAVVQSRCSVFTDGLYVNCLQGNQEFVLVVVVIQSNPTITNIHRILTLLSLLAGPLYRQGN